MRTEYTDPEALKKAGRAVKAAALLIVGLAAVIILPFNLIENVSSGEIVVIQYPTGRLKFVTQPGPTMQMFGKVSEYPKRSTFETEQTARFNDGGHGTMKQLSVQWEMPLDDKSLYELHTKFGSEEAIEQKLIAPVVIKAVYMTGPMMSSKESYAEKRNYLINYVEDQIEHGVYKTVQREVRALDPLTNQEKTSIVVEIMQVNGHPARQEESQLERFGVKTSNFSFKELAYDAQVENQIQQQQRITMDVQTAIAESRKAEQRKLTVEQQGQANAAEAKWQQEVEKAKQVTAAQQRLEVAQLATKEAEQYKQAALLKADGDAGYRKKMMEADNALQQRLDAAIKINQAYAEAIKGYGGNLVPGVVMGGSSGSGGGGISDLISLLVAQTARETGLPRAGQQEK